MMKRILVIGLAWLFMSGTAQAISVGERLEPWTLDDQFGEAATLDGQTRVLLVASSREAAELVDNAIKAFPQGYLEARDTLYVADISRMPGLIARFMAIPAMRSANYRILLDRDSQVAPERLGMKDTVLWLQLDDRQVQERRLFASPETLRDALEALSP
ncbi:hypothetical protein [Halomonas sp. WWR20]